MSLYHTLVAGREPTADDIALSPQFIRGIQRIAAQNAEPEEILFAIYHHVAGQFLVPSINNIGNVFYQLPRGLMPKNLSSYPQLKIQQIADAQQSYTNTVMRIALAKLKLSGLELDAHLLDFNNYLWEHENFAPQCNHLLRAIGSFDNDANAYPINLSQLPVQIWHAALAYPEQNATTEQWNNWLRELASTLQTDLMRVTKENRRVYRSEVQFLHGSIWNTAPEQALQAILKGICKELRINLPETSLRSTDITFKELDSYYNSCNKEGLAIAGEIAYFTEEAAADSKSADSTYQKSISTGETTDDEHYQLAKKKITAQNAYQALATPNGHLQALKSARVPISRPTKHNCALAVKQCLDISTDGMTPAAAQKIKTKFIETAPSCRKPFSKEHRFFTANKASSTTSKETKSEPNWIDKLKFFFRAIIDMLSEPIPNQTSSVKLGINSCVTDTTTFTKTHLTATAG